MDSGQAKQGIEAFQKAVELNPYFWQNQNLLGDAYLQTADYPKALEAFKQVTVLEPDIDAGYENMGVVYSTEGKYQESVPYFQKALQIEPYFSTYSNLGTAYFFLKQYSNAVEMFEKAVALSPNDTLMMVNLGDAYRYAGQQEKGRNTYQQAISLGFKELQTNPNNAAIMAQVALCYAKMGNAAQAQEFIKRARAADPTNVDYIYDDTEIKALSGLTPEALKSLQEALEKHYPAAFAEGDPELDSLRKDPQFSAIIKKYSAKKP
jgi:tetratricopeptide (TPR) repeat protein